jgi:hypothetical protein
LSSHAADIKKIQEMAASSLSGELARRQGTFRHTLLNLVTQLAAKGIHGGPTAALFADAAANEINERIDIAIQEVLRAAQSTGVRFYAGLADDLGRVLEQITEGRWNDVLSSTRDQLRAHPNPSGIQRDVEMTLTGIPASRIAKGKTDLRHFAESLSTRQRATNREMSREKRSPL